MRKYSQALHKTDDRLTNEKQTNKNIFTMRKMGGKICSQQFKKR